MLSSPPFIFRLETEPAGLAPGAVYALSDLDVASRLSFFLWSSIPDDALLTAAERGELRDPAGVERQVRRMLADPRAEALVENFAGQWLYLRNLTGTRPDPPSFPDFDDNLRQSLRRETELFFTSVMQEDRSVIDLLTADYTFVNERLARHYGIPGIYGDRFRRVPVTDDRRRGLLGQGSVLTVTSYATRTSPVLRGKWVLENLLSAPPPPPPPNVPDLEDTPQYRGDGDQGSDGEAPREPGVRRPVTRAWIRTASRSRISTRSDAGAPEKVTASRSMRQRRCRTGRRSTARANCGRPSCGDPRSS